MKLQRPTFEDVVWRHLEREDAKDGMTLRLLVAAWHMRPGQTFQPLICTVDEWLIWQDERAYWEDLSYALSPPAIQIND